MTDAVPVEELLRRVLATVAALPAGAVALADADGLVLAEDVVSPVSLPLFDNSAMDGYAVRAADVARAAGGPVVLPVVGEIGAGRGGVRTLRPGEAAKIMTGAPVPDGCDAVVPYEWTDRGVARVEIRRAPGPGQHLRFTGEDVGKGDRLLSAGAVLGPRALGLLAGVGVDRVPVVARPRVVILSTGSELRAPGEPLGDDGIYDANTTLLAAAVRAAGARVLRTGRVPDEADGFRAAFDELAAGADLVITSGGVSQGDYDVVKAALRGESSMWFGSVAMQPGKPQGFGTVAGVPVFTLPGNPVSSYVSFEVFVRPALRVMAGRHPALRPPAAGRLTEPLTSPAGRRQFLRGTYDPLAREVVPRVSAVGGPGSHLLAALASSNALVVIPEEVTALPAGAEVEIVRLDEPY